MHTASIELAVMDPTLRNRIVASVAALLAVVLAWQLASGNPVWAILCGAILVIISLEWIGWVRQEAALLGLVLVGYIIGNRGFAQLSPFGNAPIFFGEIGLAFGLFMTLVRGAMQRRLPWRNDWLNRAVLLWIVVGSIRIWHDFRTFGAPALRDFATIYYAVYFFIAQAANEHEGSRRWLRGCMAFSTTALPLVSLLYTLFPDFFLTKLTFRGVPLIYQKNDLVASFLFAGAFFLMSLPRQTLWVRFSTLFSLGSGLAWLSRAAMVALLAVTGVWSWARQWRPLRQLALTAGVGLIGILAHAAVQHESFTETPAYAIYEHLVSIADVSGTRSYKNTESADSGDNNRFRLVWWKTVVDDTFRENPWLGLGFGRDLAEDFVVNYGLWGDESFNVRSPHSLVFTMLGRLGLAGLLALGVLTAALLGAFLHVAVVAARERRVTRRPSLIALGWLSAAWVVFISSWFGVVLEGPMGAVVFWVTLGIANDERRRPTEIEAEAENDVRKIEETESFVKLVR